MARPTKDSKLQDMHRKALTQFEAAFSLAKPERELCLEDRRFYSISGAQWEGSLGDQFANRPKFEVNKVLLAVMRIISEYRNNRITVDFVNKDGSKDDDLADVCDGLYRADEKDSAATEAYDNAFEEAVSGGFGGFRFRADYEDDEDEEDERQRICIEPIFDADQVLFFDPSSRRKDKADANWAFLLTPMSRDDYEDEYGEIPASFQKPDILPSFDWVTPDVVYVAEYYIKEDVKERVRIFEDLAGKRQTFNVAELEDDPEIEAQMAAIGTKEVQSKRIKRDRVRKLILSGVGVLEDCGHIAGRHIPLVPVYGKRWFVQGIERCMGHVRPAKDPQRIANMQRSKLGELAAISAVEKPIFTPEQVSGHELSWANDAVDNYPFALVNPIQDAAGNGIPTGPLGYTKPPQVAPAMAALLQISETDLQDVLGNQQAGEELQPNMSGKAVELVQNRLDMQSFIYLSNMADAVRRGGEIWLSMAREVYVEPGRKMKSIGPGGETDTVVLGDPILTEDGEVKQQGALGSAKFDVTVDVGPSSSSRRASTVRALTGMMQISADPETQQVLGAMAMMNMDGEGISDVRSYFRGKLLKMGVVKPTEKEAEDLAKEQQGQAPDANQAYLDAAAKNEEAKAVKAQADTEYAVARTEATRAETVATLAGLDMAQRQQVLDTAAQLQAATRERQPAPPQVGEQGLMR